MTILEKIIADKRAEVRAQKAVIRYRDLEQSRHFNGKTLSLSGSLTAANSTGIIAEYKRKSPSKGVINTVSTVEEVTTGYAGSGASGLSVLTDSKYFGGSCSDLTLAKEINSIAILRKDFIIDEFQVIESKAAGADAVLLIAAVLQRDQFRQFAGLAKSLGMEVVLEVHSTSEIEMADENVDIIGVNNRDLKTFRVNIDTSLEMAEKIPGHYVKISESGISSPETVKLLRQAGYNGFLIGELFMSGGDPVVAFSRFVREIKKIQC
jgi:indole-3-glycerol phosphate synthase